jgi:HTH-type transcriptional regulator, competence development regulator
MNQSFGVTLRQLRRGRGLSQRRLAERVGVDFSYISKLENDRLPPPASETLSKLAEALGIAQTDLHAAARKLPETFAEDAVGEPAAQRFLELATSMRLSGQEWEALVDRLQQLRDGSNEGEV